MKSMLTDIVKRIKKQAKKFQQGRWLLDSKPAPQISLALSYGIIVAIGFLAFAFLWKEMRNSNGLADPSSQLPEVSTEATFSSKTEGYQFRYPISWNVEENTPIDRLHMLVLRNGEHRITIYTESSVSTDTLIPSAPTKEQIGNTAGERYRDYDPLTGGPLDRVVIKRPDGSYNELQGYGPVFERVLQSFRFADSASSE